MSGRLVTLAEPRLQARIDAPNLDAIALGFKAPLCPTPPPSWAEVKVSPASCVGVSSVGDSGAGSGAGGTAPHPTKKNIEHERPMNFVRIPWVDMADPFSEVAMVRFNRTPNSRSFSVE
jgi:hypothetical protein